MKEKFIRVPVVDDETHFIISYEDLTKEEAQMIIAYKMCSEEIQQEIKTLVGV